MTRARKAARARGRGQTDSSNDKTRRTGQPRGCERDGTGEGEMARRRREGERPKSEIALLRTVRTRRLKEELS